MSAPKPTPAEQEAARQAVADFAAGAAAARQTPSQRMNDELRDWHARKQQHRRDVMAAHGFHPKPSRLLDQPTPDKEQ